MNYGVIIGGLRRIMRIQHVQMRAAREIIGIEEATRVSAEITAAACD